MLARFFERMGLTGREQRLASTAATVLLVALVLLIPVGITGCISSKKSDVEELRTALAAVQSARPLIRERQAKKETIGRRYETKAPALAGFLEQSARAQKLEVTDSVDRPETPIGTSKRYTERGTVVHLKKAHMLPFVKFMESLEGAGFPVSVSRLNIRKRSGEPDSYDIEVGLSAYDRAEPKTSPSPASSAEEKKP